MVVGLASAQSPSPAALSNVPPTACIETLPRVTRIAFGSCAQQRNPQPIWHAVADQRPDVFVFLGDNVYGDTEDMAKLRRDYAMLDAMPGLARLRGQGTCVMATWDDHDYGRNDAGAEWAKKRESQQVFLDWVGEPAGSPRREREGVYTSYMTGPAGQRVQFILLDTRTFRSPIPERGNEPQRAFGAPGSYQSNTDTNSTLLGRAQWEWLGEQLRLDAQVRIIATSIQFVADDHHFEKWGNFPHERERLIAMINSARASGVIFISGDRHHAELSRLRPSNAGGSPTYPLWDITSSPINQTKRWGNEINAHRVGGMYFDPNFGLIEIDWAQPDPTLTLQICGEDGTALMMHQLKLSDLTIK